MKRLCLRFIFLIMTSIFIIPLTGCWNKRELNEVAIIYGIGIDAVNNSDEIEVSFQVINPNALRKQGSSQQAPIIIISAKGKTLYDAIRNNLTQFDRKLFFFSNKVVVVDEKIAKKGVQEVLDLLMRDHETSITAHMVIAKDSTAKEILGVEKGVQNIQASYLDDMINISNKYGIKSIKCNLLDFYKKLLKQGIEPTVGVTIVSESENQQEEQKKEKTSKSIKYSNAAVFQDDRLIGYFDENQTIGYNFIANKIGDSIIPVIIDNETEKKMDWEEEKAIQEEIQKNIDKGKQKKKAYEKKKEKEKDITKIITVEINENTSRITGNIENGKIILNITVNVAGDIGESTFSQDFTNVEIVKAIEKAFSNTIKERVQQSIDKARDLEADVFGLGLMLQRTNPAAWKQVKEDWNKEFVKAEFRIEVNSTLHDSGFIFKSFDE
ncbi:Ger(x)C family spore germination protein [Oscillospiraceae bacterium PP1C4]